jgi:hypothetical protein
VSGHGRGEASEQRDHDAPALVPIFGQKRVPESEDEYRCDGAEQQADELARRVAKPRQA